MNKKERTYALLQEVYADFLEVRRAERGMVRTLDLLEQHRATMAGELALIDELIGRVRTDISEIKGRLHVVEA